MSRLVVLVLLSSACGASAASVCARLDECNALAGTSLTQCTENIQQSLDTLTESRRRDCLADLSDALGNASCEQFAADVSTASCGGSGAIDTGL